MITSDPATVAETLLQNVYIHLREDLGTLLGWHLGVPALLGLAAILARGPSGAQHLYFLFNLLCFVVLLAVFYNPRFSMFLIPAYVLLAVLGLVALGRLAGRALRFAPALAGVAVLVLCAWTFGQSYRHNKDVIVSGPGEILSIARWFEDRVPVSERSGLIVARKPHIAYYLDLDFDWMPDADTPEELVREIRATGADYLYFSYMEASRRPTLSELLDPGAAHEGLRHLAHTRTPPAVLYAVE